MNKFFYIINILKYSFFLNLNNKALSFLKKILIILKINLLIITSFTSSAQAQVISESTSSTVTINSNEDFVVNSGVTLSNTTSTANAGSSGSSIVLNNFTNNGTMQGSDTGGNIMNAFNSSVKTTFVNNGVMRGKGGINFYSSVDLTNNAYKSIQGSDRAIHLRSGSTGTDLTNNGSIQGNYSSIRVYSGVTINSLTNGSTGTIGPGIFALELYGTITTLTNNGTIRNNQPSQPAIFGSSATITTLKNYGTIRNSNSSKSIAGTTVTNLYNSQSDFKFSGNLPSNYYIFIDGSNTGKITFSDFGSTTLVFAIDPSSTLSTGTYSAVVNGISSSNISSGTSGTFGGKNWALNNSSGTQWDLVVTVPDTTAPTLSSSSPADNATAVDVNANIVLNFDESVDVETGNITIKKTSDDSTVETIDVTGAKVSGSGSSQITINPSTTLDGSTEYYVLIDATAFDDSSNNSYAGISSTTALSFTTVDETSPTLSSSTPSNNATGVSVDSNIVLNFSESVDVETGNITIKKTSDDSTVETIDVTGAKVSGSGSSQITINPTNDFIKGVEYYLLIDATAFDDSSNNSYAGISSKTALGFRIFSAEPTSDKDVIGSIDTQSQLAKNSISQSISSVSNRLSYLRQNRGNGNLSKQNIKLDLGNATFTSLANELLAKNDKSIIPDNWSSWSKGSISVSKIGDRSNSSSSETDGQALAIGFDTKLNDNDLLGFAIQYGKSDTDIGSSGSTTDSENINLSIYRTRPLNDDNFIEGMFGVGLIESDLTRISGANTLTGSRNGTQIFGSINYGKTLDKGDFNLTPIARVDLGYTELDAYSETGTDALSYAKQTIESGLASVGVQFSDIVKFNDNKFKPFGSIEYGMDFSNSSNAKMNYVSDTSTIYTYTQEANSNHLITSVVGFEYITINNLNIISSYKRIQGNESEQTDIINVAVNFKSKRETEYAMSVDGSEDLKAGFDISKNINGFDLKFNANQSLSENSDQAANVSLSRSY